MGVYTKAEVVIEHLEHFNIQMIRIFRSYVEFNFVLPCWINFFQINGSNVSLPIYN